MKVNPVGNITFEKVARTSRKEAPKEQPKEENKKVPDDGKGDVYETTVTYTETFKVPKGDKTLQQFNRVV